MTCDRGNVGLVRIPGGSIAYEPHSYGMPWVIAFQVRLTKAGSVFEVSKCVACQFRRGDSRSSGMLGSRHCLPGA